MLHSRDSCLDHAGPFVTTAVSLPLPVSMSVLIACPALSVVRACARLFGSSMSPDQLYSALKTKRGSDQARIYWYASQPAVDMPQPLHPTL